MWSSYYREQAVSQVVAARLDANDVAGARKAAELLANPAAIGGVIVAGGDLDADSPMDLPGATRGRLLERIARSEAEHGQPADVLVWARGQDPMTRLHMLRGLAAGITERLDLKATSSKPANAPGHPKTRSGSP
jgi:hypothetical protein